MASTINQSSEVGKISSMAWRKKKRCELYWASKSAPQGKEKGGEFIMGKISRRCGTEIRSSRFHQRTYLVENKAA